MKVLQGVVGLGRIDLCYKRYKLGFQASIDSMRRQRTLGNAHCLQDTVNKQDSIEAFPVGVDLVLDLAVIRVGDPRREYIVENSVVKHGVNPGATA